MFSRARLISLHLLALDTALVADQVSKYIVLTSPKLRFAGDVLFLHLGITPTINKGFAFSLPAPHFLIVGVGILVFAVVLYAWFREMMRSERLSISLALVVAGGLGNLIDRLRLGGVVDFIEVGIKGFSISSFNLADVFIIVGVLLWVFWAQKSDTIQPTV